MALSTTDLYLNDEEALKGFYQEELLPELEKFEHHRQQQIKKVYALGAAAITGLLFIIIGDKVNISIGFLHDILSLAGFVFLFGGVAGATYFYRRLRKEFKQILVARLCEHLGLQYQLRKPDFPIKNFVAAGIIPRNFNRSHFEDYMSGEHDNVGFRLCEGHLRDKSRDDDDDKDHTRFKGLLLIYDFNKPFNGDTRLLPNVTPIGNRFLRSGYKAANPGERVTLEDPKFRKQFDVYSTDQVESRYLLTPGFMERLQDLRNQVSDNKSARGANMYVAFSGGNLMIAIHTDKDRFEGGSLFKNVVQFERVDELITEIRLIYKIIDVLNLTDQSGV